MTESTGRWRAVRRAEPRGGVGGDGERIRSREQRHDAEEAEAEAEADQTRDTRTTTTRHGLGSAARLLFSMY